jgi:hypothetical protein
MDKSSNFSLKNTLSDYVTELEKDKSIVGAVLTGSAGRGDRDAYSDVDIVVFLQKQDSEVREGKFDFKGQPFDVRISEFARTQEMVWTPDENFAYLNSETIYDPQGQIREMITQKKSEWTAEVSRRIILSLVQLSVILQFEDNWKGLKADTHYKKFISRGDYFSAHRTLNLGLELVLDLNYLLNDKPPPDYKNKLRVLERIISPSVETLNQIKEFAQLGNASLTEAERKYELLKLLTDSIKKSVALLNQEFPGDFYQFYLKNRA